VHHTNRVPERLGGNSLYMSSKLSPVTSSGERATRFAETCRRRAANTLRALATRASKNTECSAECCCCIVKSNRYAHIRLQSHFRALLCRRGHPLSQVMLQPPNPEGAAGDKVNVPSQDKLSINVMYHATSNRMTSEAAPGGFEAMDLPARASRQLRAKNRIWELEGRGLEHKRVACGLVDWSQITNARCSATPTRQVSAAS